MDVSWQIIEGNCLKRLAELPEKSVHCVVTSPPYFGLREYGTARWVGGDPMCDHATGRFTTPASEKQLSNNGGGYAQAKGTCPKCGAVRVDEQIGLEPSPEAYVDNLVAVFREIKRVLRDDGTVWLNLGDSYAGSGGAGGDYAANGIKAGQPPYKSNFRLAPKGENMGARPAGNRNGLGAVVGIKPKDLIGIPWRVAFALQADGWWLRSDIIFAKKSCMPEGVQDRPTKSHEFIFLLTKSPRYYYDWMAIAEPAVTEGGMTWEERKAAGEGPRRGYSQNRSGGLAHGSLRNKRDVWTLGPEPFKGAHYAVMPTEIPRLCISAGTSEKGVCPKCGAPWKRVVEREDKRHWTERNQFSEKQLVNVAIGNRNDGVSHCANNDQKTVGWQPTCTCNAGEPVPATVLDPFSGAGTTVMVALRLGRNGIGIELNHEYAEMSRERIINDCPMLNSQQYNDRE